MCKDWQESPVEILNRLSDQSISNEDLYDTILFAEINKFNKQQTIILVEKLFIFVEEYRFCTTYPIEIIVGAAVRKLGVNYFRINPKA